MYSQIPDLIRAKKYNQAIIMLNEINNRNAVWYYLSSIIAYKKAFFESALENIKQAISLDSDNTTYKNFQIKLMSRYNNYSRDYRRTPRYRSNKGCCPCNNDDDCCGSMCCCCDFMGYFCCDN